MGKGIRERIGDHLHISEQEIIDLCKLEFVTNFLLTWSCFETTIFSTECSKDKVMNLDIKLFNQQLLKRLKLQTKHFFERYQDKDLLKKLERKGVPLEIVNYINEERVKGKNMTDLQFLAYVVFRYRNNIFHGNKQMFNWKKYQEQIEMCTDIMMTMVEEYKS